MFYLRLSSVGCCAVLLLFSWSHQASENASYPEAIYRMERDVERISLDELLTDLDQHADTRIGQVELGSLSVADLLAQVEAHGLLGCSPARKYLSQLGISPERLAAMYLLRLGFPPDTSRVEVQQVLDRLDLNHDATIRDVGEALFGPALEQQRIAARNSRK